MHVSVRDAQTVEARCNSTADAYIQTPKEIPPPTSSRVWLAFRWSKWLIWGMAFLHMQMRSI